MKLRLCRVFSRPLYELEAMPYDEYLLWHAEFQRQPFGDDVEILQRATVGASIVNRCSWGGEAVSISQFIPTTRSPADDEQKNRIGWEMFVSWAQNRNKRLTG